MEPLLDGTGLAGRETVVLDGAGSHDVLAVRSYFGHADDRFPPRDQQAIQEAANKFLGVLDRAGVNLCRVQVRTWDDQQRWSAAEMTCEGASYNHTGLIAAVP